MKGGINFSSNKVAKKEVLPKPDAPATIIENLIDFLAGFFMEISNDPLDSFEALGMIDLGKMAQKGLF
jgi:hypothetical protein